VNTWSPSLITATAGAIHGRCTALRAVPVPEERAGHLAISSRAASSRCSPLPRTVYQPRLLILDEATEGLAPVIREEIWRCLDR